MIPGDPPGRLALLAALALLTLADERLTTDYERKRPVRVEVESKLDVAVTEFAATHEGDVVQSSLDHDNHGAFERSVVFVNEALEHEGRRPVLVRRHFEEIACEGRRVVAHGDRHRGR